MAVTSLRHNQSQKQAETCPHPLCLTPGEARALVQSAAPGSLAALMDAVAATPTPPGWELVPLPMADGTWDCIATCGDWCLALDDRQPTAEAAAAAAVTKIKRISRMHCLPIGGYPLPAGIVTHPGSVREELIGDAEVLTLDRDPGEQDAEPWDGFG
jgi:hypothetical protein